MALWTNVTNTWGVPLQSSQLGLVYCFFLENNYSVLSPRPTHLQPESTFFKGTKRKMPKCTLSYYCLSRIILRPPRRWLCIYSDCAPLNFNPGLPGLLAPCSKILFSLQKAFNNLSSIKSLLASNLRWPTMPVCPLFPEVIPGSHMYTLQCLTMDHKLCVLLPKTHPDVSQT